MLLTGYAQQYCSLAQRQRTNFPTGINKVDLPFYISTLQNESVLGLNKKRHNWKTLINCFCADHWRPKVLL